MDKAILVGIDLGKYNMEYSLEELENVASALNIEVIEKITQRLDKPNIKTCIGSGKVQELKNIVQHTNATMVIFDEELTPAQIRNLEKELDTQIIDRSFLILSIFAERAKTKSAMLEVSLAQQKYLLPRLVGMRSSLSRQGGGTYNAKGPGETKLELDRRVIQTTISKTEQAIKKLDIQRKVERKARTINRVPLVSLVGYTNAGKSATLNTLIKHLELDSNLVYEEDVLFATLDTTARRISKNGYPDFILSDTIGFLTRLPHEFINSFKSTLKEIENSDLIIHIVDGTSKEKDLHIKTTKSVLKDLNCEHINSLEVYTRLDLINDKNDLNGFWISNKTNENIDLLINHLYKNIFGEIIIVKLRLPYNKQNIVSELNAKTRVLDTQYLNDYVYLEVKMFQKQLETYKDYLYSYNNSK